MYCMQKQEIQLNEISRFLLMHADDTVIFAHSEMEFNEIAWQLEWLLNIRKLDANTDKTKICVFERRKSMRNFNFKYRNIVLSFTFCYTGNFKISYTILAEQAMERTFCLYIYFVPMNSSTKLYIFDRMILSILLYGSEVISINVIRDLQKTEIKYCKVVLNENTLITNVADLFLLNYDEFQCQFC